MPSANSLKFVQIPYEKFIYMVTYNCEAVGIKVRVHEKSYTSKTSLLDWDNIPTYNKKATEKSVFSGNRSKQVWYKAVDGILIQADVNGSHNISRKVISTAYFLT